MKQRLSILLALVVLLQCCSKTWLWIGFELNRDYIAKYLCENRNNANAGLCRGQCYYAREARAETEREQQGAPEAALKMEYEVAFVLPEPLLPDPTRWVRVHTRGACPPLFARWWGRCRTGAVFQPPEQTC